MDGFNATIFAYGQSGSGKTFSMLGPEQVTELLVNQSTELTPEVEAMFGIVPRATFHIFDIINEGKQKGTKYTIKVSYIEIYNESINDILSIPPAQNLKLREFPNQGMCVIGMQEALANSPEAVFEVISAGTANKIVCSTGQNARSSRSHTVFILTCEQVMLDGSTKHSKINLVDLAGSEKLSKTGAQGQALKEAQKINLSLTTLGRCIKALTGKAGEHIPFRESKLTLILKESLGGNSKTTLIVTGSMRRVHQEETIGTLQFAERAKMVKTAAKSNIKRSVEELEMMVEQMKEEITRLHKQMTSGTPGTFMGDSAELQELRAKYVMLQNSSEKKIEELLDAVERNQGNTEYAQERMQLLKHIEEVSQGLERARYEKEAERSVYEEFIQEIMTKSQESESKLSQAHKDINILNLEVSARDELLMQISQEKREIEMEQNEYKEMLIETKTALAQIEAEKVTLLAENQRLAEKYQEMSAAKTESDVVIDKLEYFTQSLYDKIETLEYQNSDLSKTLEEYIKTIENLKVSHREPLVIQEEAKTLEVAHQSNIKAAELEQENTRLVLELKRAQEEIEVIKSTLGDSRSDSYEKMSKMKKDMDKAIEDKQEILRALLEFKKQIDSYDVSNKQIHIEHAEQKTYIMCLLEKSQRLERELEEEQRQRARIAKSLKFYEEKHEKLAEDIETNVRVKQQLQTNAYVKQIVDLRNSLEAREKEINELKTSNKGDLSQLKSDLTESRSSISHLNSRIKLLMTEYEAKIDKLFQEKEVLKVNVSDKMSENLKLKMDLSEKDSVIYQLKIKAEQAQGNISRSTKEAESLLGKKNSPHKNTLFFAKKMVERIPQEMIKSIYANIDSAPESSFEEEQKERDELYDIIL